jgi:hypothetical protein
MEVVHGKEGEEGVALVEGVEAGEVTKGGVAGGEACPEGARQRPRFRVEHGTFLPVSSPGSDGG